MTVESKPLKAPRSRIDWPMLFGRIAAWMVVGVFGGIFWAINGGFSVAGLGVVASAFNSAGALFWDLMSSITFSVPVHALGLPTTQPLLPWIGVLASSILEVVVAYMKLRGRTIPLWLWIFAGVMSIYDLGTTYVGMGVVTWLASWPVPFRIILALVLTFAVEAAVVYLLKEATNGRRSNGS